MREVADFDHQSQWTHDNNHHRQLLSSSGPNNQLDDDCDHVWNINGTICAVRVESDSICWWPIDLRRRRSTSRPRDDTTPRTNSRRLRQYQRLQHQKRLELSKILNAKLIPNDNDNIHQKAGENKQSSDNKDDYIIKQKELLSNNNSTTWATDVDTKLIVHYVKSNEHRSNFKLLKLRELTIKLLTPKQQHLLRHDKGTSDDDQFKPEHRREKDGFQKIDEIQQQLTILRDLFNQLQNYLQSCRQVRPKRLLIFVNPFGGKGKALKLYNRRVKRLLELADVERKLIITKYANHARETIEDPLFNVEYYDGIISVGGDGMFAELMNGLLFRYNRSKILAAELRKLDNSTASQITTEGSGESNKVNKVIADWRKLLGGIGQPFLTPPIPLGMIGAGSTDANSFGFYGTNDVTTSTLNILLGNQIQIDVCSVHSYETDRLLKFVSTFIAYGYFGDIIRESERLRWLGPSRYEVTALNILLKMRTYNGLVRLLVSDNDGSPRDCDVWCHNNCHLCQMNRISAPLSMLVSSTDNDNTESAQQHMLHQSTSDSTVDATASNSVTATVYESGLGSNESLTEAAGSASSGGDRSISGCLDQPIDKEEISYPKLTKSEHFGQTNEANKDNRKLQAATATNSYGDKKTQHSMTMLDENHDSNDKDELSKLRLIERKGAFTGVNAAIMACRCPQTWKGFSPGNHLGNGCADLILVKPCSRAQYINYLLRTGMSKKSAFDLKYVDAFRCRQFEFISADGIGVNNLAKQQKNSIVEQKSASLSSSTESEQSTKSIGSTSSGASSGNGTGSSNVLDMTSACQMSGPDTSKQNWNGTIASTVSSTALSSSSSNGVSRPVDNNTDRKISSAKRSSIGHCSEIDGQLVDAGSDARELSNCNRRHPRECSSWNIDGEVLEEQSIRVKVNKQLLIVFGTGEPQRAPY